MPQLYASKMNHPEMHKKYPTEPERETEINQNELNIIRFDAGKLAWLATATSKSALFQAIVVFQSIEDKPRTVSNLLSPLSVLSKIKDEGSTSVTFLASTGKPSYSIIYRWRISKFINEIFSDCFHHWQFKYFQEIQHHSLT